jgi:hypothetical protein
VSVEVVFCLGNYHVSSTDIGAANALAMSPFSPPLPAHPAAVYQQRRATHVAAGLAGEIDARALEVVGRPPPAGGDAGRDAGEAVGVLEQALVHVGLDVARGDGVDGDAAAGPLVGEALCQLADGALGGGVGGHGEAALEGQQRRKVDDAAAAARHGVRVEAEHVGAKVAAEAEDGAEVDLDDLVEVAVGEPVARVPPLDARAVDEDPDLVAVGEHLLGQGRDLLRGRDVGRVDPGLAAELLDGLLGGRDAGVALLEGPAGERRDGQHIDSSRAEGRQEHDESAPVRE